MQENVLQIAVFYNFANLKIKLFSYFGGGATECKDLHPVRKTQVMLFVGSRGEELQPLHLVVPHEHVEGPLE